MSLIDKIKEFFSGGSSEPAAHDHSHEHGHDHGHDHPHDSAPAQEEWAPPTTPDSAPGDEQR